MSHMPITRWTCDRCDVTALVDLPSGKETYEAEPPEGWVGLQVHYVGADDPDLCPDCWEKFKAWLTSEEGRVTR